MRALLYSIIVFTLFSCGSKSDVLTPIMGETKSHFRGNSIGDKYQNVLKNTAKDNPSATGDGILNCEFKVEDADLLVRYEFDQEKLYAIQADIFFADSSRLNSFEKTLIDQYNASYGAVDEDGGFLVWQHRQSNTEVELALADESIEFGQPKLSLTIYNFGN